MQHTSTKALYALYKEQPEVCTDTRKITKGCLFFALKGDNFNGNDFAKQAIEAGAAYAVVDDPAVAALSPRCILVEDVLTALQDVAKYHRNQLQIPIIGLTGSNGKTTTKELIYSVLSQKFKVSYTQGNLNNHIGVPLTLLRIRPEHEIAIVEMGANHQKEIQFLTNIAQPDWGYVTNFGKAHLEGFGGVEGVIKGKSELYTYLRENGKKALVNADDDLQMEKSEGIERTTFGTNQNIAPTLLPAKNGQLWLSFEGNKIGTQLTGNYNFNNACCALSFGLIFGLKPSLIIHGLTTYTPENNRSQIVQENGQTLIMDAYNANPTSMEAALRNLAQFSGKKMAVLGDMLELGNESNKEHKAIFALSQELGIDEVILVGKHFTHNFPNRPLVFQKVEDVKEKFTDLRTVHNVILVKGSRGIQLEKLFE